MPADVLSGIKVVELSMWAFVPSAGAVLADWGADVVKIVPPDVRDPMSGKGVVADLPPPRIDTPFMWELMNRGKRCAAIDVGTDGGYEILGRLLADADVFLTNLLPAARRKLRVEPDDIRAINDKVIYGRGTGQGPRGPEAERSAFDTTAFWARSGIGYMASQFADEYVPLISPAFGDTIAGFTLASGVVAALLRRERTGKVGIVDASLLSAGMHAVGPSIVASAQFDIDGIPRARHHELPNPLMGGYKTKDGRYVMLAGMRTDVSWKKVCQALNAPALGDDERFVDGEAREVNRRECIAELDAVFATRTLDEWTTLLADYPAPWCIVQVPRELFGDPQVEANGFVTSVQTLAGALPLVTTPVQFDEQPIELERAPGHGEHTDDILRDLGYSDEQIVDFKLSNAIL